MKSVAKVFLIIGMVCTFYLVFPIVLGIIVLGKLETARTRKDLTKWGVLSIIFVSMVGGILVLCIQDKDLQPNIKAGTTVQDENDSNKYESLSYDELSQISRDDHQEDVRQYDKQQNALCLVMIGTICLICGALFLVLSFVRKRNKLAGLDVTSLPFFVSIACFVAAAALLTIGLIRFFKAHNIRKALEAEIIEVTRLKTRMMSDIN